MDNKKTIRISYHRSNSFNCHWTWKAPAIRISLPNLSLYIYITYIIYIHRIAILRVKRKEISISRLWKNTLERPLSRSDLHASESLRVPRGGKPRVLTRSRSTVIKVDHRSRSRPVRTEIRTVGGQTEAARAFRSTIERSVDVDRSAKSGGNVVRCAQRYRLRRRVVVVWSCVVQSADTVHIDRGSTGEWLAPGSF